jgi:hypothetical protein
LTSSRAPTESEILQASESGTLAAKIFDRFGALDKEAFDATVTLCVELHNSGKINLLLLTEGEVFESIDGFQFFVGQNFFLRGNTSIAGQRPENDALR